MAALESLIVLLVPPFQTVRALLHVTHLPGLSLSSPHLFGGSLFERLVCWHPPHFVAFAQRFARRPVARVRCWAPVEEAGPSLRRAFRWRDEVIL